MLGAALLASVAVAMAIASTAAAKPQRIVSLNLCADQLVLQLAEPANIASVTHHAADPELSYMAAAAAGIVANRGRAEEVVALDADLVFTVAPTAQPTVFMLRRLGIEVVELPLAESIEGVRDLVRQVAARLGEEARGEATIAEMDARFAALAAAPGPRPRLAVLQARGHTAGPGTLIDEVVRMAGFENIASELGIAGSGYLGLEALVLARPDAVVISGYRSDQASLAVQLFDHPALRSGKDITVVAMPVALWLCATPAIAAAAERLVRARDGS